VSVRLLPVEGLPEIRPGADLAGLLIDRLATMGIADGDVLAVTQKIVSKAEGRVVPAEGDDRSTWVERESVRVVARRGDLIIAETRHGFVCANAGVDASNIEAGFLSLLPLDPDASAEGLRSAIAERLGARVGVVVTDTFGRPWRQGLVNVAIGCAGLPALVDLRGTPDHHGRALEATIVAFADEVAAASGLVMGKAARVPAALVRGLAVEAAHGSARDLVRPPAEDLFRESPLLSISTRRTIRSFGQGAVPRETIEEAIRAAWTAPAPHRARPWSVTALESPAARRRLVAVLAEASRDDLRDGRATADRVAGDEALLGAAPVLLVPWMRFEGVVPLPDSERRDDERDLLLLSAGAAIQNLLLALHAQGIASCWTASTLVRQAEARVALEMGEEWFALGIVAAGPMPAGGTARRRRPPPDLSDVLRVL
jgi:coenzyme F420-0:L-glutamate ligase/coenzyme F420-1:gamma-L-glutamate ligase